MSFTQAYSALGLVELHELHTGLLLKIVQVPYAKEGSQS